MDYKKIKNAVVEFLRKDYTIKEEMEYFTENGFTGAERNLVGCLINNLMCQEYKVEIEETQISLSNKDYEKIEKTYQTLKSLNLI